jgi:tetratricopeptide (TPR) repeat protein
VILLLQLLQHVPFIGGMFHGLIGFWVAAILLSVLLARVTEWSLQRRRLSVQTRALGHVDTPHIHGKLGSLLLTHKRAAEALPHLDRAVQGEPELAEWQYRRGLALLELKRPREAIEALQSASDIDAEHAYGAVQLGLANAYLREGDTTNALAVLDRFDTNHGPSPESAYRRGVALKKSGRAAEARECFHQVGQLAERAARFQKKQQRGWVLRAWLAR